MLLVIWIIVGVLLWWRTMRIYGPQHQFDIDDGGVMHTDMSPLVRLLLHVLAAPIFLVAILGKLLFTKGLVPLDRKVRALAQRLHAK